MKLHHPDRYAQKINHQYYPRSTYIFNVSAMDISRLDRTSPQIIHVKRDSLPTGATFENATCSENQSSSSGGVWSSAARTTGRGVQCLDEHYSAKKLVISLQVVKACGSTCTNGPYLHLCCRWVYFGELWQKCCLVCRSEGEDEEEATLMAEARRAALPQNVLADVEFVHPCVGSINIF